ncbi:MAG: trehalose-phosphatase [Deltaproteobacteria bacterium]|nr:trehalose-phosphatase [Deltaproteobacteria bacterium]
MNSGARRLWVFDFDGTLSPLVPDRNAARLHQASRSLLKRLAADPRNQVAVLSSRSLEDLARRVPLPDLFLGGGSGLEWRLPDDRRVLPGKDAQKKLEKTRGAVFPALARLSALPGVELEDKRWSVAVHFRRISPGERYRLPSMIHGLKKLPGIRVFEGPAVAEVQFLRSAAKSFGIRRLCGILKFDPSCGSIFYAGDDENDAAAMRWVISKNGIAVAVGNSIRIPAVRHVDGPMELSRIVRELADSPPPQQKPGEKCGLDFSRGNPPAPRS